MIRDARGVLDLPLRLTLTLLIVSLSLPVADAVLQMQERDAALRQCEAQANALVDAATIVYYQGDGAMRTVTVDVPRGSALMVADGGICMEHRGSGLGTVRPMAPPFILIADEPMRIEGRAKVVISAINEDGMTVVILSST